MSRHLHRRTLLLAGAAGLLAGCGNAPVPPPGSLESASVEPTPHRGAPSTPSAEPSSASPATMTPPAEMVARATVPVLCYHQIRDWTAQDSAYSKSVLICPPSNFRRQLDGLAEAGWTTITPADYLAHPEDGTALPDKPVILSFDDGKDSQPNVAAPELSRRNMRGVFFIMTVVIGKSGWISKKQIADLADQGHVVGSHTWDHHSVTDYSGDDWRIQFQDSRATLQRLSGQAVDTFAYPYGAWNPAALPHLSEAGYSTAFQLTEKPIEPGAVPLTLRRILVDSRWDGAKTVAAVTRFAG